MKRKILQNAAVGLAGLGLLGPALATGAERAPAQISRTAAEAPAVVDVALLDGGVLLGQVVDGQGQPVGGAAVSVQIGGQEVAVATTDAKGYFSVRGLRGGNCVLSSTGGGQVCRLWTSNSAPPAATKSVLVVAGGGIERGQSLRWNNAPKLLMVGVIGGIVTAGVITDASHKTGS